MRYPNEAKSYVPGEAAVSGDERQWRWLWRICVDVSDEKKKEQDSWPSYVYFRGALIACLFLEEMELW